jgi:hypothetical protein
MLRKVEAVAVVMLMLSYASAGTVSIGTASARGDMRVDNYMVHGDATLFDGSVIETTQASADLRLQKNVEVILGKSSRATLYRDRMVLDQGETELTASTPYRLDTSIVRVTPNNPNSRWTVSLKPGNNVEVTALTGTVGVTSEHGIMLANLVPGRSLSFAMQQDGSGSAQGGSRSAFSGTGVLDYSVGFYFLTVTETGVTYQIVGAGDKLARLAGQTVTITGTLDPSATPEPPASAVIDVHEYKPKGAGALLIDGLLVVAGIGAGVGVYYATAPSASP